MSGGLFVGIVLAAGRSSRAGCIKALATLDGEPFVSRVVSALRDGGCAKVSVVVGPPHGDSIARAVPEARRVDNEDPSRGMLSSLREALAVVEREPCRGVVIALVDQPRLRASTVRALIDAFELGGAEVVSPCHRGRSGHPYLLGRDAFAAVLGPPGAGSVASEGSVRPILARLSRRAVELDDPAVLEDLDTPDELRASGAVRA